MITTNIGKLLDTAGHGIGKVFARYKIGTYVANNIGERITKTLEDDDISSGKTTLAASGDIGAIGSITVISSAGAVRVVSSAVVDDDEVEITATGLAKGDTVTIVVYP
jgi:hypothetical protein